MNEGTPERPTVEELPTLSSADEPRAGDRVGPYRLVKALGHGTGGRVFEVVHDKLDRPAALKLLDAAQAARPSSRARFLGEALAVNRISHPHIVEVTDVVDEADQAALVMELLEGQSLGAAIEHEAPLAPERFLPILAQICEGLAAAHAAGFVHRDLKPENVFLCARPETADFVKLLDFGVATTFGPGSSQTLPRGALVGTPAYAAPEQASGGAIDHTADIYAVGVMLYELTCGRLPYEGWTAGQFLIQHLSAPVPRLPANMRATPLGQALDNVVQRCMAKQPSARFSSAAELAATFRALACGDFVTARATLPPLPAPRRPSRAFVLGGLGVAAALGLLSLAFFVLGRGGEAPMHAPGTATEAASSKATAPAPFVTLTFTSDPAGAEVHASGGELYGVTPFSRAFPRSRPGEKRTFEVRRRGYAAVRVAVEASDTRAVSVRLPRVVRRHPTFWRPRHVGSEKTIDPFRR